MLRNSRTYLVYAFRPAISVAMPGMVCSGRAMVINWLCQRWPVCWASSAWRWLDDSEMVFICFEFPSGGRLYLVTFVADFATEVDGTMMPGYLFPLCINCEFLPTSWWELIGFRTSVMCWTVYLFYDVALARC
ncbi:hypothetical protein Nepgr_023086 [Nepenthes gracilis]|uniref:Uncharacterized protein n=1 Tax=Nepenthes gracilis TaxID=150966 RepID=A0AAD3T2A0_NEPGR|nr:hypothetical protein Nepgr_023086 [Nepenthes gracilis]